MTIREEVQERIRQDPDLNRIRRKIENGNATYADTSAYSIRSGKLLGEILSGHVLDIPAEDREQLCVDLLHDRYVDINLVVDEVQSALDAAQGLRIAPHHAPENTERSHQIGTSLRDPTKPDDVIQRRAGAATETATKAVHDDRMESEAKFRKEAGLKSYLNRVAAAGCCPWCSDIAGRYVYGDHPGDIFRRHDNCDCSVTFESGRQRQDVWSKKTWEARGIGAGAGDLHYVSEEQAKVLQVQNDLTFLPNSGTIRAGATPQELFDRKAHIYTHKEDLYAVNPHFSDGDKKYKENCTKCVIAYAFRRRGYNVEALPYSDESEIDVAISRNPNMIWKKSGLPLSPIRTNGSKYFGKPEIIEAMRALPDGAMFEIRCEWKDEVSAGNRMKAHVFIAEKINGRTHFIDPQSGSEDVSYYFSKIKKNKTTYWRIDNASIDENYLEYCCSVKGGA